MQRRRRPRSGPDSVWRILRRLAREARRHEEWRRRFEIEERARERAFRRRLEERETAWRQEQQERDQAEAARRREVEAARRQEEDTRRAERKRQEAAWRQERKKEEEAEAARRREREREEAAWRQERKERDAKAEAGRKALERAVHRMIGDGDERFGRLMEALTDGDLIPMLRRAGFDVTGEPARRRAVLRDGMPLAEMDLIAFGKSVSVGVEVKTTLRPEYVRHFVRKMERFRELFPEYAAGAVHGAVAYLTATESAPVMAARRGLLLIRVVGSSASIVNAPAFKPRDF